eukprot:560372_1
MFSFWTVCTLITMFCTFGYCNQWKEGDMELPKGMNSAAIGTINNRTTYIIGGYDGEYLDTVYKLDTSTTTPSWVKLSASAPKQFLCWSQCSITINDELIYIINPMTIDGTHGAVFIFNTTNERFIASETQTLLMASPPIKYIRSCVTMSAKHDLLFVLGGIKSDYSAGLPHLQVFNLTASQWTDTGHYTTPPLLRLYSSSCHFDDRTDTLYAFGGYGWYKNEWQYLQNIYVYNMTANDWNILADQQLAYPRDNTRAVSVANDVYIMGGYGAYAEVSTVDQFNLLTRNITSVGNMLINNGVIMATKIQNEIHVFGGGLDGIYSSNHEYLSTSTATTTAPFTTVHLNTLQATLSSVKSTVYPTIFDIMDGQYEIEIIDMSVRVLVGVFFLLPLLLCLIGFVFHCRRKGTDHPDYLSLFWFFTGIGDLSTDIAWAVILYLHGYGMWLYAFVFTVGSHVISIVIGFVFITKWRRHRKKQYISDYIHKYDRYVMLCMIFSSFYTLVDVMSSHLFHVEMLSLQINEREKRRIQNLRLFNEVLLENLPLLALQTLFLWNSEDLNMNNVMNQLTIFAIIMGLISMLSGILTLLSRVLSGCCHCGYLSYQRIIKTHDSQCNYEKIVFLSIESMKGHIKPYHIHTHKQLQHALARTLQIYVNEVEVMCIWRITNGIKARLKFKLEQNIDDAMMIHLEDRSKTMGKNLLLEIEKHFAIEDGDELIVSVSRRQKKQMRAMVHPHHDSLSSVASSISSQTNSFTTANAEQTVTLDIITEK